MDGVEANIGGVETNFGGVETNLYGVETFRWCSWITSRHSEGAQVTW